MFNRPWLTILCLLLLLCGISSCKKGSQKTPEEVSEIPISGATPTPEVLKPQAETPPPPPPPPIVETQPASVTSSPGPAVAPPVASQIPTTQPSGPETSLSEAPKDIKAAETQPGPGEANSVGGAQPSPKGTPESPSEPSSW